MMDPVTLFFVIIGVCTFSYKVVDFIDRLNY